MRHSDEEIREAAERFEKWADELDPATADVSDVSDLRAVAEAADAVRANEARLTEAVSVARAHGRSWTRIAESMGVSRQAARQRFSDKIGA
ncbi:sigma-70 family RNA polymerase sigma factor [Phytoactinopolyspora halotolerans]|uniref:Sigma-70 family RNA polymerase sigma factor n=1 Tax=Phytoactinopolyspora halotolerans TaxID=1981512 RepID=A0A6L9SF96_9ACTN|nr:sigma-70 family RNA polymerase sigma factor [Phytoactinopolyspora halotolerans]NEE03797.1 sigma-70 family RNA polymerase sigma factor [Phytoactinopolyspora halotolerans]